MTPDAPAMDMSITVAHNCAIQFGISREAQDQWALRSHQRAIAAIDAGAFIEEIVPIDVPQADGSTTTRAATSASVSDRAGLRRSKRTARGNGPSGSARMPRRPPRWRSVATSSSSMIR